MKQFRWELALACGTMGLLLGGRTAAADNCKVTLGGPAPQLSGEDLAGGRVDLEEMRGKWVYLDFWASWCKPCMRELPGVVDLHEEMGSRSDFAVMSIALDDQSTLSDLEDVRRKYQVSYPVLCDSTGWSSSHVQDWCVKAIPTTFLIDPTGRVVERDLSPSQVKSYLSRVAPKTAPLQYQPQQPVQPAPASYSGSSFNAKHRVLRDSPTSGKRGFRDLQVSLPSPGSGSARYLLVVRGEKQDGSSVRIRYDLEFAQAAQRKDFPFSVTIHESSGDMATRLATGEKSVRTGSAVDFLPGAQIAYDWSDRRFLFVLPLPPELTTAAYTASIYSPPAQSFVDTLAADISI